jgi:hypothetical protein
MLELILYVSLAILLFGGLCGIFMEGFVVALLTLLTIVGIFFGSIALLWFIFNIGNIGK